jgi:hypothetical protein
MNDIQLKKRGRVKGSSDSVFVSLAELQARLGNDVNATVPIRRKWWNGVDNGPKAVNVSSQDGDSIPQEIEEQLEEPVAFTVR